MDKKIKNQEEEFYKKQAEKLYDIYVKREKKEKFWEKYRLLATIIIELIMIFISINVFIKPYIEIYMTKKANIIEATIIEDNRRTSLVHVYMIDKSIKYEYYVDNQRYESEKKYNLIGLGPIEELKKGDKIKIYYYKDEPSKSRIYQENIIWKIYSLIFIIATILILIKIIKWNK
ncbi:MAG: hypothetical protein HFJ49_00265 [Clostridia bacterium]|nr:hypothetical protein [Clostridia bacterium]